MTFPTLQIDDIQRLSAQVEDADVKKALFSMKPWKALSPDGFPIGFYQKSRKIIGNSMCNIVKRNWSNSHDLVNINQTDNCLILKVEHP